MDSDSEYNEQIRLKHYRSLEARKQQTNRESTSKKKNKRKNALKILLFPTNPIRMSINLQSNKKSQIIFAPDL